MQQSTVSGMYVRDRKTGERLFANYCANRLGNMRYHINGKSISDKSFTSKYRPSFHEEAEKDNLLSVCNDKKVVFLEKDDYLPKYGPEQAFNFLGSNSTAIVSVCASLHGDNAISVAMQAIKENDIIIFQTQWVFELSHDIKQAALSMKEKKTFIEVYIHEPHWFKKPKTIHDVYALSIEEFPFLEWEFYKLSENKMLWEFKNKFDQ